MALQEQKARERIGREHFPVTVFVLLVQAAVLQAEQLEQDGKHSEGAIQRVSLLSVDCRFVLELRALLMR